MYLKRLSLINFKNIAQEDITFVPGITCFVGDNGAGKTNILDAIYYLSMCKSAFAMSDTQSIRHGEEFFCAEGAYERSDGRGEQISCTFARHGGKTIKRNGKEYDRISDHVGLIPIVIISPADATLVIDAADERRRYLNACISQFDRGYLTSVMRYNTILAERNKYLKNGCDEDMLLIYDRQLAEHGQRIYKKRMDFINRLQPLVETFYAHLADGREHISLNYRSELHSQPLMELFQQSRQRDVVNQFTTTGIHRDDLQLFIDGHPLRKYGSQGQQKSFLIALKLAQCHILTEEKGEFPILLLDDLFDKLDLERVGRLMTLVSGKQFGQTIITDCNKVRLEQVLGCKEVAYRLYTVQSGSITEHFQDKE
jgi:DNA replication and repair protein RecF